MDRRGVWIDEFEACALERAAEVLWREGSASAGMRSISAAMEVACDTVYRHYGSKTGLARAVIQLVEEDLQVPGLIEGGFVRAVEDERIARARSSAALVAVRWRELATYALEQPALFGFAYLEERHPEGTAARIDEGRTPGSDVFFERLVERARERGEVRDDVSTPLACTLLWGALTACIRRWRRAGKKPDDPEVGQAFGVVWRGLARRRT